MGFVFSPARRGSQKRNTAAMTKCQKKAGSKWDGDAIFMILSRKTDDANLPRSMMLEDMVGEFTCSHGSVAKIFQYNDGPKKVEQALHGGGCEVAFYFEEYQYDHLPASLEEKNLGNFLDKYQKEGLVVVKAETRNTVRWRGHGVCPRKGRGDLAFYCGDMEATVPIFAWADEIDEYPKCVNGLKSAEFGDILRRAGE